MNNNTASLLIAGSFIIIAISCYLEMKYAQKKGLTFISWVQTHPAKAVAWTVVVSILIVTMMSDGGATVYTNLPANFTPRLPPNYTAPFMNISVPGREIKIMDATVVVPNGIA